MSRFARFPVAIGVLCLGSYAAIILFARTPAYCALSSNYADSAPCYRSERRVDILFMGSAAASTLAARFVAARLPSTVAP